jgi:hypothetical protein
MVSRLAPLAALALLLPISGCYYLTPGGFSAAPKPLPNPYTLMHFEVLSLINTHKTLGDHIFGWITDKDCSSPRSERGEAYCRDWPGRPAPPPQVYCYSTLARPSCYAQPYNEGNDRLIGFVPPSTPQR